MAKSPFFAICLEKFTSYLKSKNRSACTLLAYHKDVEQLAAFLAAKDKTDLANFSTKDLADFMENLAKTNYAAKSISRKTNAVKTFFRFLKSENLIPSDPALDLTHPPYENTQPRVLNQQEYRALRDACRGDHRTAAMVEILLQTGIKISELVEIGLSDIKNGELKTGSSIKNRLVPINKASKTAIERYLAIRPKASSGFLFITKTGRPLLIRNVRTAINRYFKAAGVEKATINDLRNTFIAYQLANGVSLDIVNRLAGHKRISSTERYLGLLNTQPAPKTQPEEL